MSSRVALVGLITVATATFVLGVALERSAEDSHDEASEAATQAGPDEGEATHSDEGGEGEASHADEEKEEAGSAHASAESSGGESDATLLGIDFESTPLVILVTLASLALAASVWIRPELRLPLGAAAVAMVVFAVFDVRELTHQLDEDREGLALLAGVIAALHLGAAALAAVATRAAPGGAALRS